MFGWFKKKQKVVEDATEAMVESIIEDVKKELPKEKHIDCECAECIRRNQNAK
jgi:hypothetical protein